MQHLSPHTRAAAPLQGKARQGKARQGKAVLAWHGMAWFGRVCLCVIIHVVVLKAILSKLVCRGCFFGLMRSRSCPVPCPVAFRVFLVRAFAWYVCARAHSADVLPCLRVH